MLEKYIFYYILLILVNLCSTKQIDEINNICKKISTKYFSPYTTVNEFLESINYNFGQGNNNHISHISYNFLLGNDFEEVDEFKFYLIIKNYLINVYIIPIILLWIFFSFLFFKKLLIFNPSFHFKSISKLYQNIIIIILFFCTLIYSIIILSKIDDLNSSMNDAFCNLLKFFYQLNHGKIKETEINQNKNINISNTWPGLYELNSFLLDSSEAINKIALNGNKTFLFLEEINIGIEKYKSLIDSLIDKSFITITNPNCYQDNDIIPRYSYEFNDVNRNNSYINIIYEEFSKYFRNATELIKSMNNYCNILSKKSDFYDIELNNFFENISDFSSLMKETSLNITNNIIIFQEHSELILRLIKTFNIYTILLSLFIIILMIIQSIKNFALIKLILNIIWNLSFLLIIFNLTSWYFFHNLEEINYNIIYIMEKNILNTESNMFFNTCLNTEHSDLKEVIHVYDKNSALIDIDRYYKKINPIYNSLNNLEQEIPTLETMKLVSQRFNKYLNHYELSTNSTYKNSDVSFILNEISKLTNKLDKNHKNNSCNSNDIWVSSKKKCQDYQYISRYEIKKNFERKKDQKYCFIIQDYYKESDIQFLYGNICKENAYNQILNYIIGLTNYYNNNENLLNSIEKIFKDMERYNKKLSSIIISQIKICQNDLADLIDIYNPILGNVNITNFFNCGGLKRKIINFYDINYNQIVFYCKFMKVYTIVIIILQLFGNVCIMINNRENKPIKRKYLNIQHRDINNDGVELIEEVSGEDEDSYVNRK